MKEQRMRNAVLDIPGEAGWYCQRNLDTYQRLATTLRTWGMPAEDVMDLLTDAYWAAERPEVTDG